MSGINELNIKSSLIKLMLSDTFLVTAGSLLGVFFSYLLQLILAKLLSVADYGTYNSVLSLSYILHIPSTALSIVLVKLVAEISSKGDKEKISALFRSTLLLISLFGFLVIVILLALRTYLSEYLNIDDSNYFIFLGFIVLVGYINLIPDSFLQGIQYFKGVAQYKPTLSFLRMVFPILLVLLVKPDLLNAFSGLIIGPFFAFIFAVILLRKHIVQHTHVNLSEEYRKMFKFGYIIFFVHLGLTSLTNTDMILVKKYFSGELAGYYAGTITLGKILFYGSSAVSVVMFPRVASLFAKKHHYKGILARYISIQLLLLSLGVLLFTVFPKIITTVFFGQKFVNSVEYLPLYAIYIGFYALVYFLVLFLIAVEKVKVLYILITSAVLQYILISLSHGSLNNVLLINISLSVVLLISTLLLTKSALDADPTGIIDSV